MLTCQEVTELITDYLEGRMSLWSRAQLQMHLGMCRHCRAYLRQMRMTVRTLGKLPSEPIPSDVRDALLARFRNIELPAAVPRATWPARWLGTLENGVGSRRGWGVVAILVLGMLISLLASRPEPGPPGDGISCLLTELGIAGVTLALLGFVVSTQRVHLSAPTWTVVAVTGGLAGFAVRQVTCEAAHTLAHIMLFHAGGVILAAILGAVTSRLPAFR